MSTYPSKSCKMIFTCLSTNMCLVISMTLSSLAGSAPAAEWAACDAKMSRSVAWTIASSYTCANRMLIMAKYTFEAALASLELGEGKAKRRSPRRSSRGTTASGTPASAPPGRSALASTPSRST